MDNSFVFYRTVYEQALKIEELKGKELSYDYLMAVIQYGLDNISPSQNNEIWLYGLGQSFYNIDCAKNRYNQAVENGKKGGAPQKYDRQEIAKRKSLGQKNTEIAKDMNCSLSTVEKVKKYDDGFVF